MWRDDGTLKILEQREIKKLDRYDMPKIFYIGQILEVNGGWFRVKSIKPNGLRLKSVPKPEGA